MRQNEFLVSVDPELLTVCVREDDIFLIGLLSVNGVCRALGSQKHMGFGLLRFYVKSTEFLEWRPCVR